MRLNGERRAETKKWARHVVQMRDHLLVQTAKTTLTDLYNEVVRLKETPDAAHPVAALVGHGTRSPGLSDGRRLGLGVATL